MGIYVGVIDISLRLQIGVSWIMQEHNEQKIGMGNEDKYKNKFLIHV